VQASGLHRRVERRHPRVTGDLDDALHACTDRRSDDRALVLGLVRAMGTDEHHVVHAVQARRQSRLVLEVSYDRGEPLRQPRTGGRDVSHERANRHLAPVEREHRLATDPAVGSGDGDRPSGSRLT
jgi:hypothetical protein